MARMLGKSHVVHSCPYGCCSEAGSNVGPNKTFIRRLARRRERQATKQYFRLASNDE